MTQSGPVGQRAVAAVDGDFHFLGQQTGGWQVMKLNAGESSHKVKMGGGLRKLRERRGGGTRGGTLTQREGEVSHRGACEDDHKERSCGGGSLQ